MAAGDARMVELRKQLMRQSLRLKPEVAGQFWPRYERYLAALNSIRDRHHEILGDLGENYDNMSDEDARDYVARKLAMEEDRLRLLQRMVAELEKLLPPLELARFVQIEEKIKAFIDAGIEEEIPLIH
ncbi:hypothetical protein JCM19379_18570 [Methyloparacoccus murrellii]